MISGYFLAAVAESLKEQFPDLVSHRMRGQLVTPNYDGGLVLHGLCAHSGTGDVGYRLVAAADPEEWVRHPTTTACFLADSGYESGTLASMCLAQSWTRSRAPSRLPQIQTQLGLKA